MTEIGRFLRLRRDLARIHRLLKHFDLRWRHLKPLIRIVEAFLYPLNEPASSVRAGLSSHPVTGSDEDLAQPLPHRSDALTFHFPEQDLGLNYDAAEGDFFFEFDSFELHPASMWAYRPSIPNTPG